MKRDVLTLSVCSAETVISRAAGADPIDCFHPAVDAVALCHGGEAPDSGDISGASPLQEEGGRGASVRSIQFDLTGFTTCWLNQGPPLAAGEQQHHVVRHYMALCRAEYDVLNYNQTGTVVPVWPRVPNIILSAAEQVASLQNRPMHDPDVEIFWRGLEEAIAAPCFICPPCGCEPGCFGLPLGESCTNCGTMAGPQWFIGTVNMPSGMIANQSMARQYAMRHVKLRTGRFLKENQAIFLVSNWTTSIPQQSEVIWETSLYGTAAVKVAR